MGFIKEFKEFAFKGNVIDLAIAVIIGGAFGKIVTSLVDDVITPLLLNPALEAAGVSDISKLTWGAVKYGNFLSSVISFLAIALVIFIAIRTINRLNRKEEAAPAPAEPSSTDKLLIEIRDQLARKS